MAALLEGPVGRSGGNLFGGSAVKENLRAAVVSVDFADLLDITLGYNRHHFAEVMVVTAERDVATVAIAEKHGATVFTTNAFYEAGAVFNKWKALEQGLDAYGRHGWMCLMDADILWPKYIPEFELVKGVLYTPRRRMMTDVRTPIPQEPYWAKFPMHPQQREWAGFTQIFHSDDPVLPPAPWHQTNWKHAGGADSFFQMLWPDGKKVRPPFEVLHLGDAGVNWCGRVTPFQDGSTPPEAPERIRQTVRFVRGRNRHGNDRFSGEKY